MKEIKSKLLLDTFSEKLNNNFLNYCEKHDQNKDIERFITYVLDQNLIPHSTIRKYTILETYEEILNQHESKTKTVNLLADRFNLSTRSIWNLLRMHKSPH